MHWIFKRFCKIQSLRQNCKFIINMDFLNCLHYMMQLFKKLFLTWLTRIHGLNITQVLWYSPEAEGNLQELYKISIIMQTHLNMTHYKSQLHLPRPQWVNPLLPHWGLMTPYDGRDLGQHWLRWWLGAGWHHAITWTNVDLSSVKSYNNHLSAISQQVPQPSIGNIILKIAYLKFYSNLPGVNELNNW